MPRLEDILKAKGYTDADIAAAAPLLQDQKFRSTLETEYNLLDTERTTLKTELADYKTQNEAWEKYNVENVMPQVASMEKRIADTAAEKAALEARLKLAQEAGYAPRPDAPSPNPNPTPQPGSPEAWDPKKHNVPTWDDVHKLADAEGRAIAMMSNLQEEYRYLTGGKSLFEYSHVTQDGRTLYGAEALRHEAQVAKAPNLYDFAAKKFDFSAKRNAIADQQKKAAEEAIRKDERTKVLSETLNPNTRQGMPSNNPFIPRTPCEQNGGKPKLPWQVPAQERRAERLNRIMETQLKSA